MLAGRGAAKAMRGSHLRLLLKTSIREGLLERDSLHQEGVGHGATGHLFDPDHGNVQLLVERQHCVDHHGGKEVLVLADEL